MAKVNNRYFNSNLAPYHLRMNPFHLDLVSQCVLLCSRLVNATPLNLSQIWPQMKNLLGLNIKSQQMNQGCNLSLVYYLSTSCLSLDDTAWQTVICIVQNRFDVTAFSHLDSQKIFFFFQGAWKLAVFPWNTQKSMLNYWKWNVYIIVSQRNENIKITR